MLCKASGEVEPHDVGHLLHSLHHVPVDDLELLLAADAVLLLVAHQLGQVVRQLLLMPPTTSPSPGALQALESVLLVEILRTVAFLPALPAFLANSVRTG